MADGSIDPSVAPEKNEDGGNTSKSCSHHAVNSSNKNSVEKSDFVSSNRNLVPHYLRASTGTCHDFCKYGKKHLSEEKARKPLRKTIAESWPNDRTVQIMVSGEQDEEKVVNRKSRTDTESLSPDDLNPSHDIKSCSPKPKTSSDKKRVIIDNPLLADTKIQTSLDKKTYLRKSGISSDATGFSPEQNASPGNKPVLLKSKPLTTIRKCPSPEPVEIIKSLFFPSDKAEYPVKKGSSADNKTLKGEKKTTYLSNKHSPPVKPKPVKVKPLLLSSPYDNLDGLREKGRKNSVSEAVQNMTSSKLSAKKIVAAPRATATLSTKIPIIKTANSNSRKAGNSKLVSHLKDRNGMRRADKTKASNSEKVSEKILHVIKTENKNSVAESTADENSSSLSSHEEDNEEMKYSKGETDEFISDKNEPLVIITKVPPVKENYSKTLKRTKVMIVSEDNKNQSPMKLKFRNGKAVDVQSNINSPRRLRFGGTRDIVPEGGRSDLRRRVYKQAAASDVRTGEKDSSVKVVLKHQDVQSKKDAQCLLNNVIEQTASRLVESRKSKVKALVGAFETVISLQECKPSSQAVG